MRVSDVLLDAGRPIAYHPGLARALGSIPAALMLAQLIYWSDKSNGRYEDGWVWKIERDWDEELAFTPDVVKAARSTLVGLRLVEHRRRGLPAKPYYRVDFDALDRWWADTFHPDKSGEIPPTSPGESHGHDGGKATDIPLPEDDSRDDEHSLGPQTLLGVPTPPPPAKRANARKPSKEADPLNILAKSIADDEWKRRPVKPVCGYVGFRARIREALAAGHTEARLRAVLPSMTVFSRNAFDFALGGTRGRSALPANDRALAEDPSYWGDDDDGPEADS